MQLRVFLMSFAVLLRGKTSRQGEPVPAARKQHKYDPRSVEASIELGERVVRFLEATFGPESSFMLEKVATRARGSQPSRATDPVIVDLVGEEDADSQCSGDHSADLPYGFWRRFMTEDMHIQYTHRKRMQLTRSLQFYLLRKQEGASTMFAMRGMRDRGHCRSSGGSLNARKAAGLGFQLLQFFVDHVQRLMCRADSCLLMKKARELRTELEHAGWPQADLPKLEGNAGHQWFQRWRQMYGIVRKVTGMKLKVPWAKVKRRIRVFLGNIYRLRAFWEVCHPDTPMRFISLDQKPSWFNNAGHTGTFALKGGSQPSVREDFNKTRERYTILTTVPSWGHTDPDVPPKVAILVKAKPDGRVERDLRTSSRLKPWMLVQAQENGSYRSEDMVKALDWMLPSASNSTESIIVLLDWYSGHLTEEVADVVRSKGHVLVFHGGGCTPFTQINDTHLHALLARVMIQIENDWALQERQRLLSLGQNKTPKMTREEMLSIVQTAWLSIDHARVAEKGYRQTGPTMALRGPVAPEDVFKDLLRAMEEIEPSPSPTEVGMTLRDEAVAFVNEGFDAGKWTLWADCQKLIEDHDGVGEALEEGLEAFGASPEDTDTEDDGDTDDEDDDKPGGGPGGLSAKSKDAGGGLGDGDKHGAPDGGDHDGDDGPDASAGGVVHIGDADAAHSSGTGGDNSEAAESDRSIAVAAARQVLYGEAVRKKDDLMLRHMRKQMRGETQRQRDADTEVGVFLRKRAHEHREAEAKRRREALEEERLAAKNLEETKVIRAKAEEAAAAARLAALSQIIANRRDTQRRKHEELVERAFQRWLQTQYPAMLARRCTATLRDLSVGVRAGFEREILRQLKAGTFQRQLFIKELWSPDKSLTLEWARTVPFTGGARCFVRCGLPFQELVDEIAPRSMFSHDPVETLSLLFMACVPCARRVFTAAYRPLRLLHVNDYVLEKAFVYGIVALSKWLGEGRFPQGVYGSWPPKLPADFLPTCPGSETVEVDATAPIPVPPLLGHADDEHLPPHLRIGLPAASSGSSVAAMH